MDSIVNYSSRSDTELYFNEHFDELRQRLFYILGFLCFFTCVCVVCVFFPFILDIKCVGCTSRGHTGVRSHTVFFIHLPSAVRAFIFLARRIQ